MDGNVRDIQFSEDYPLPETEAECAHLSAKIIEEMDNIDLQFSFFSAGLAHQEDPSWHPRALARKGHISRFHKRLKAQLQSLKELRERTEKAERERLKEERIAGHAKNVALSHERYKMRYQHLQDWVNQRFPEFRDELREVVAEGKAIAKSMNDPSP